MLSRRELASIAWYGTLFSAVVGWAVLRRSRFEASEPRMVEADTDPHGDLHRVTHRVAGQ